MRTRSSRIGRYARDIAASVVLATSVLACTVGRRNAASELPRNSEVLTVEEVRAAGAKTAYDGVVLLRPQWLRPQGGATSINSPNAPHVAVFYAGYSMAYSPQELRNLTLEEFVELRHLKGIDSALRYGKEHEWGAIVVTRTP